MRLSPSHDRGCCAIMKKRTDARFSANKLGLVRSRDSRKRVVRIRALISRRASPTSTLGSTISTSHASGFGHRVKQPHIRQPVRSHHASVAMAITVVLGRRAISINDHASSSPVASGMERPALSSRARATRSQTSRTRYSQGRWMLEVQNVLPRSVAVHLWLH